MIHIFKKHNTKELIEQIHNEFNCSGESLLKKALEIINQSGVHNLEKSERLKRAGFINSYEHTKLNNIQLTKELADLIQSYQIKYPLNKFLTEDQVNIICEKYNLVCAPVDRYKGFVPETKLSEIEKFNINDCDIALDTIEITEAWNTGAFDDFSNRKNGARHIHRLIGKNKIAINHPSLYFQSDKNLFGVKNIVSNDLAYVTSYKINNNNKMLICAPEKDMDLSGLKNNKSIFNFVTKIDVPDPVVLKPCNGGYLIVCAWGDEASDEIVVNQKYN